MSPSLSLSGVSSKRLLLLNNWPPICNGFLAAPLLKVELMSGSVFLSGLPVFYNSSVAFKMFFTVLSRESVLEPLRVTGPPPRED